MPEIGISESIDSQQVHLAAQTILQAVPQTKKTSWQAVGHSNSTNKSTSLSEELIPVAKEPKRSNRLTLNLRQAVRSFWLLFDLG